MKMPFECAILDSQPVEVCNPFSGQACTLTPEAVAVYDTISGANMMGDYKTARLGLDWFQEHFPEEYMILLD